MLKDESEDEISNYFSSNLLELRAAIQPQDWKRFASLNSAAERIGFVLNYAEAHSLSLETDNQAVKSSEKALQLKDIGNKYFGRGEFLKALETYSNAVLLAPLQGN